MTNLQQTFTRLAERYSNDSTLVTALWEEIETAYSAKGRFYHNLSHLENLVFQLTEVSTQTEDWDTLLFSLFYHDIVYSATAHDNEEKSAELAAGRLKALGFPEERTAKCVTQILATKGHSVSEDTDTNLFTDADLSILGMEWPVYAAYFAHVRQEYAVYPDLLYNPGRRKVLKHFLSMERIFKTPNFFERLEQQARRNLQEELKLL